MNVYMKDNFCTIYKLKFHQLQRFLEENGLKTVEDLLCYLPFRYEDRSHMQPIATLRPGMRAAVLGEIKSAHLAVTRRRGFRDVVIGLSGGVDSALVAYLAARAFGPEHVHAVMMPSRFTSSISGEDATAMAQAHVMA